jgi:hypothetical protein
MGNLTRLPTVSTVCAWGYSVCVNREIVGTDRTVDLVLYFKNYAQYLPMYLYM